MTVLFPLRLKEYDKAITFVFINKKIGNIGYAWKVEKKQGTLGLTSTRSKCFNFLLPQFTLSVKYYFVKG